MSKFVVISDAVVVTTGVDSKGRPTTARMLRGEVLTAPDEHDVVETLLGAGSIAKARNTEHVAELQNYRQTAKMAATASGAPDDPIAAVAADILPLDAPLPDTAPPVRAKRTNAPVEDNDGDL